MSKCQNQQGVTKFTVAPTTFEPLAMVQAIMKNSTNIKAQKGYPIHFQYLKPDHETSEERKK